MTSRALLILATVALFLVGCDDDSGVSETSPSTSATPTTTTTVASTTTTVEVDEVQIEMTYNDDGTSYTGDREIIEGTVTIVFSNESEREAIGVLLWYETGSAALAEELEFLEEGAKGVPGVPAEPYAEIELDGVGGLAPGSHSWTVDLEPGTYIFDVGPPDFHTTGLWRAAIFEVVSD